MTQFNGRTIRSKHTYQKGVILGINEKYIIVSFTEEETPMPLTYDTFLKNCLCDEDVKEFLESKNGQRTDTI